MAFAQSSFARLIATGWGRLLRVVAGVALIGFGLTRVAGASRWLIAIVGLGPLYAGAFDQCLLAPIFGAPLDGEELRQVGRA